MNLCFTEAIEGFPGYLVTRDGRVISIQRKIKQSNGIMIYRKGSIMKGSTHPHGYRFVTLRRKGFYKRFIHVLVARAFIPNPNNKRCVNHINGIKTDNRIENLEWATHSENMLHAYKIGLRIGKRKIN